jgi:hypothetical protein
MLLGTDGGLWSDMDVIHFRPFEEAYFNTDQNANVDTIISYTHERNHYSIGYMFGSAGNPFYHFLYKKGVEALLKEGDRQTFGVILWNRYYPTPTAIQNAYPQLRLFNVALDASYSFIYTQLEHMFDQVETIPNPKTVALHWYGGHPIASKWENILTEENYMNHNSTIINCIKRALSYEN